jgi:adenosine kinase
MVDLAKQLAAFPKKNSNKSRIVIITSGPKPASVAHYCHLNKKFLHTGEYEPENISEKSIVDTNGAGDAFAGGFLAYYSNGCSIESSVKAGHMAASVIIQKRGCDIPKDCDFELELELI